MPRAKNPMSKYSLLYADIGNFKTECTDILADFKSVYPVILKDVGESMGYTAKQKIVLTLEKLQHVSLKTEHSTRVYIITNARYVPFAMLGMDKAVVENLKKIYDELWDEWDYGPIDANFISHLFIFIDDELVHSSIITPAKFAKIMAGFSKENIVNFSGVRDSLYGAPRRMNKRSQG